MNCEYPSGEFIAGMDGRTLDLVNPWAEQGKDQISSGLEDLLPAKHFSQPANPGAQDLTCTLRPKSG